MAYGDKYELPEGAEPPTRILHKECGGAVNDRRICERCGAELDVRDARAISTHAARREPVAA